MMKSPLPRYAATCILVFMLFLHTHLSAQSISVPGYYITLQGDTIRGTFPAYRQWNRNPAEVEFIDSAASQPLTLTPSNALKFYIENHEEYLSFSGQRLVNPIEDNQLEADKTAEGNVNQYAAVTTFLRLIFRTGGFELYVLSDRVRSNFFYRLNDQPLSELRYKKYYNNRTIHEVGEFRQQLHTLFSEEITKRKLVRALENLPYTETGMMEFFTRLTSGHKARKAPKDPAAGWVVSAGASLNTIQVKGDKSVALVGARFTPSVAPMVSVGHVSPVSRNFGRYFFYPQLKLFLFKNATERNDGTFIYQNTFQSDLVVSGEVAGGAHIVNGKDFKAHLSAGGGIRLLVNNRQTKKMFAPSNQSLYASSEASLEELIYVINAAAGVTLKNRLWIQATYDFPVPIANFILYSPRLSGIQVRVGYKLRQAGTRRSAPRSSAGGPSGQALSQ